LIGIVDQPGRGASALERHLQGVDDQISRSIRNVAFSSRSRPPHLLTLIARQPAGTLVGRALLLLTPVPNVTSEIPRSLASLR
jgi:hypothetical protein